MRNTIYFKQLQQSLSESDKEQYRQMSINQQKDWYIMYLEQQQVQIDKPMICKECQEVECECDRVDFEGYELDEDGRRLSCCGDVLDPDVMICPICKEHN